MRHLDGRCSRARIAVEGEQARGAERVEGRRHRLLVDLDRVELPALDAAAGVLRAFAEGDQSQEELPGRIPGGVAER